MSVRFLNRALIFVAINYMPHVPWFLCKYPRDVQDRSVHWSTSTSCEVTTRETLSCQHYPPSSYHILLHGLPLLNRICCMHLVTWVVSVLMHVRLKYKSFILYFFRIFLVALLTAFVFFRSAGTHMVRTTAKYYYFNYAFYMFFPLLIAGCFIVIG